MWPTKTGKSTNMVVLGMCRTPGGWCMENKLEIEPKRSDHQRDDRRERQVEYVFESDILLGYFLGSIFFPLSLTCFGLVLLRGMIWRPGEKAAGVNGFSRLSASVARSWGEDGPRMNLKYFHISWKVCSLVGLAEKHGYRVGCVLNTDCHWHALARKSRTSFQRSNAAKG